MFLLHKPSEEIISQFISSQREVAFTYTQTGATQVGNVPSGYYVDHNRAKLGTGNEIYEKAIAALRNWKQFDLGWVSIVPSDTALAVGAVVAVRAQTFGVWSLNACRIVYVIDEEQPLKRFGFAYGTLPDHVECGEERFIIEQQTDGSVLYDIFAFSRPRQRLVKLAVPIARRLQRRFVRDSIAAMTRAVKSVE
ncbi:MAG TPA: DUF1990 domain-containing protein [Pyrinomonadaceae bacterium]|nr:DUF1990 domain-containing protein [Pyrinomonadaceae bacterium]